MQLLLLLLLRRLVCMQDLGGPSAEGACTDPQKALDHMLETLADSMRGMQYDV